MDTPISAFEVYKSKRKERPKQIPNKKKKGNKTPITKEGKKSKNLQKNLKKKDKVIKKKILKKKIKKSESKIIEKLETRRTDNNNASSSPQYITEDGPFRSVRTNSVEEGFKVFKWLIAPYSFDEFIKKVWEHNPLYIARKRPSYYKDIISTPLIDNMLRNENILFTKNIDITSYADGKKETHNPVGRAHPHVVWDYYLNGCSIRLLNPQTYLPRLHALNATLQEFTNSFVGANAYLTPPDSQGFAPHYDDIEAFILQIEGKKKWRVYSPLSEIETLPRYSSKNFDQDEIGEPILEVTLEAGDLLYFPRGYIHQGVTIDGEHSLHITVSMYQKHSWADLFEKMVPAALQMAISDSVELRRGLPLDIYNNFGLVYSDIHSKRKDELTKQIFSLFDKIKGYLPIDLSVDEMNKQFQRDALPPLLTDSEKAVTVYGNYDLMTTNGKIINRVQIESHTNVRLLRKNILRMVIEDKIRIYYYAENSLEYHGNEEQFLEIDENLANAVECLILNYPKYTSVGSLPTPKKELNIQLCSDLWEKGLIMTEYPLIGSEVDVSDCSLRNT